MADPHCKTPAHLRVEAVAARATSKLRVQYISPMGCDNRPTEEDWGVVVSKRRAALEGLHLRPSAVAWMPGVLRTASALAATREVVLIYHTVGGVLYPFAAVTPAAALTLADDIEALL